MWLFATAACNFSTSELPNVVRDCGVLYILTCKCAFRHSGVQFFSICTSKSGPGSSVFNIFTSECAFRHSGVQFFSICTSKSGPGSSVFLTFSLPNVLFATAACNFSTSELPNVVRDCGVLRILTCECAFHHSGVQFLMSPLSTYLRTRRFNRPNFGLTRHTNLWKNTSISWLL